MKNRLNIILIVLSGLVLLLTIRGVAGNPNAEDINSPYWLENGPFELSPERGRFALTYSLVEEKSTEFSLPIARFATPDLGYKDGRFVSLFAPGVSFIVAPGYLLGKALGISQVGTYLVIALFAVLNAILIHKISRKVGAGNLASWLSAFVFLFATPAFSYAVNLYQHHISVFLILLGIYSLIQFKGAKSLFVIFLLYGISISVDYPNAILMLPILLFSVTKFISKKEVGKKIKLSVNLKNLIGVLGIIIPLMFFFWFNKASYGSFTQLAGTVADVDRILEDGTPVLVRDITKDEFEKATSGFFETRNLINGLYIHTLSSQRGVLIYAPIVLFGIFGYLKLRKEGGKISSLLISIVGINIVLYSLWGDPWGGWAFGSRYLIPSYAIMSIFISQIIPGLEKSKSKLLVFSLLLVYSVAVNTLGAVTSSSVPPKVEVEALSTQSGRVEKYTYERNLDLIEENKSKSFVFNELAPSSLNASQYYLLVLLLTTSLTFFPIVMFVFDKDEAEEAKK